MTILYYGRGTGGCKNCGTGCNDRTAGKGYDTLCTSEIFSQGQWQLLSIARAAVAKPKLLLLDEITANLDAQTEEEVLQALKRASEGRTVISISHRVNAETGRIITFNPSKCICYRT